MLWLPDTASYKDRISESPQGGGETEEGLVGWMWI